MTHEGQILNYFKNSRCSSFLKLCWTEVTTQYIRIPFSPIYNKQNETNKLIISYKYIPKYINNNPVNKKKYMTI